jgi:hypothetical protein
VHTQAWADALHTPPAESLQPPFVHPSVAAAVELAGVWQPTESAVAPHVPSPHWVPAVQVQPVRAALHTPLPPVQVVAVLLLLVTT